MARTMKARRSGRIGGFLKGLSLGLGLAAAVVVALVFLAPPPETLDGDQVAEVDQAALEAEIESALKPVEPADQPAADGDGAGIRPVELPELAEPAPQVPTGEGEAYREALVEEPAGAEAAPETADAEGTTAADLAAAEPTLADEPEEPSLPPPLEDAAPPSLSGPALSVNAASYEAAADAPLLGVIIGDAGSGELTPDVLFALPVPATLAIVPGQEGDRALADAARARNWEVVAELPIVGADEVEQPGALTPAMTAEEVAARTEALMGRLSQSVAALDGGRVGLGDDPGAYEAMVRTLEEHGFAFVGAGEAAAGEAAEAQGLAYARANGTLGPDASAEEVYAALDEAAAEAEASGTALLVLPPTRAALGALARWNAENGGGRLAPLSAVIRRQTGG